MGIVLARLRLGARAGVVLRSRLDGHECADGHREEDGDQEGNVVTWLGLGLGLWGWGFGVGVSKLDGTERERERGFGGVHRR